MRLGLAAWQVADLPETRAALLAASAQPEQGLFTDPDTSGDTMRQLSDDGSTLLSIGRQGVVEWDVRTGRQRRRLPGVGAALDRVAPMRGDGLRVLEFSGSAPPTMAVAVRDLAGGRTGSPLSTDVLGGATTGPEGRLLVTYDAVPAAPGEGRRERAVARDATTGKARLALPPRPWREPRMGEGFAAYEPAALEARRGSERREIPLGQDVILSPDDRLLAWCLPGEPLQLWDLRRRRSLTTPWAPTVRREQCGNEAVRFSPDGRVLAVADDDGIRTWDIATGHGQRLVERPGLMETRFSPDGRFLAAADHDELLIWRTDDPGGGPVFRYALGGEEAAELRFDLAAGSLSYLAGARNASGWPRTVRTLDIGRVLSLGRQRDPAMNAEFSPSGTLLAVARGQGDRAGFRLRDLRPGGGWTELPDLPCPNPEDPEGPVHGCATFLAFGPDSRTLVYGTEAYATATRPLLPPRVVFWDITRHRVTGTQDVVLPGPRQVEVGALSYAPDGRSLLVVGSPALGSAYLWDPRRRAVVRSWPGVQGHMVATAPDGSRFVTSDGQVGALPEGRPGAEARTLDESSAVAFSPDGALLAAGDPTGRVVLWDGRARSRLGELRDVSPEAPGMVVSLAFSPDSRLLAVGGDGSVEVWDVASRTLLGPPLATGESPLWH